MKYVLFLILAFSSAFVSAQEYVAMYTGKNGYYVMLFAEREGCPGGSRFAIINGRYGVKYPSCWINNEVAIVVRPEGSSQGEYFDYDQFKFNPNYKGRKSFR